MKRVMAAVLAGVMAFSLTACGGGAAKDAGSGETAEGKGEKTYKVALMADGAGFGSQSFNDVALEGLEKAKADFGIELTTLEVKEVADFANSLRSLAQQGCDLIITPSSTIKDAVTEVAAEYPDIQFCHATGYQAKDSGLDNMHNYFASIYEARYLAGIAAGMKTESNKLGYVAAFPFAEVISGYTAFYLGAKSVNPDVTMDIMYTNSWNDPTVESQVAKALIERGCDVISQHSDSTAPATTAEENGAFQVGYNNDMIEAAPKASLISARIDWGIYVTEAVQNLIDGKEIPVDWCKGLADGAVYLSPLNTDIAAEGTQEAIIRLQTH